MPEFDGWDSIGIPAMHGLKSQAHCHIGSRSSIGIIHPSTAGCKIVPSSKYYYLQGRNVRPKMD